jgi:hypothetical protein
VSFLLRKAKAWDEEERVNLDVRLEVSGFSVLVTLWQDPSLPLVKATFLKGETDVFDIDRRKRKSSMRSCDDRS